MSYEGEFEYLCARGHYHKASQADVVRFDGYGEPEPETCLSPGCSERMAWWSSIYLTNGIHANRPETLPAPKVEVGWDDIAKVDHYGNHYFEKALRYELPVEGGRWRKILTKEEVAKREEETERFYAVFREPAHLYRLFSGTDLICTATSSKEFDRKVRKYRKQGFPDLREFVPSTKDLLK